MTVHMTKLAVGIDDVDHLARVQEQRRRQAVAEGRAPHAGHVTRMMPRRLDEVLDDGSMYWVIRGAVQVRQRILDIEPVTGEDGIRRCRLVLDDELVRVVPRPCRAFQGWRYLKPADVPGDIAGDYEIDPAMPPGLREELRSLGLL